jgi:hypothetical protein
MPPSQIIADTISDHVDRIECFAATLEIGRRPWLQSCANYPWRSVITESGGVITMTGVPKSGTATATGTAWQPDPLEQRHRQRLAQLGPRASDINLNATAISNGRTVTLNSGTCSRLNWASQPALDIEIRAFPVVPGKSELHWTNVLPRA